MTAKFLAQIHRVPQPETEYRFHPERRWRFDYAWPAQQVALEVEGGVWSGGRHTRGAGFISDIAKYNSATLLGWQVYRCTPQTLAGADIGATLRVALSAAGLQRAHR